MAIRRDVLVGKLCRDETTEMFWKFRMKEDHSYT